MAIDIKELAKNVYKIKLLKTVEDYEELLSEVYEQGLIDGSDYIVLNPIYTKKTEEKIDSAESELSLKAPNTQPHYDNSKGSLYKVAQDRGWDAYQFDIVKRIDRSKRKGEFKRDLQKTKDVIDIYLAESDEK